MTKPKSWLNKLFSLKKHECVCHSGTKNLCEALAGRRVRIEGLKAEEGICHRLREMGFCERSIVEKVTESGALICRVCDAKVALSRDLAQKIIVKDICSCEGHGMDEHAKTIFLSQMSVGQRGIVEDFTVQGDGCERIEEMGVTPGEPVEVIRYAPLGDPIEIKIRGYLLSLRKKEADLIKVKLLP